ncbi:MAG: DUF2238 domain-containing protein [Micavibrio sp.]|nr:DUF2238 domain-containing protein [Micavibrio sp.]
MEAFPIFAGLPLLIVSREKIPLTCLIYCLLTVHAMILLVGAHYTYAEVPLGNWAKDYFHFSRNHYDRLGHFMQGLVPALLARELLLRTSPLKAGKWLFAIIVLSCLGISALYELLEWQTAVLKGEAAEAFLGTQGDVWDTQEDMATALFGAIFGLLAFGGWHDRQLQKAKYLNK